MKTKSISRSFYLLPISLVFILLFVHSNATIANNELTATSPISNNTMLPPSRWSATLSDSMSLSDVIRTSDGRFVVAGNSGSGSDIGFLAKLNEDGTLLWQNMYNDTEFDSSTFYSVIEVSDGNLIAVGEYHVFSGNTNALVSKFDQNGNVLWQKEIGGEFSQSALEVIHLDSGDILIIGKDLGEISDGWLIRMDTNGNIVWQKRYGDNYVNSFNGGVKTSDGNIVLAGVTWSTFSYPSADAWLVKINNSGEILWQKAYHNSQADYFRDIVETGDGDLVVAGGTNSSGYTHAWAMKLSGEGNVIWEREWSANSIIPFNSVLEAESGRLIFAGNNYQNDSGVGWLVALDEENSTPLWEKFYGTTGSESDRFSTIIPAGFGDILVAGYTESFSSDFRDGWLLKLAEDGSIFGCNLINSVTSPSNPTTTSVTATTIMPQTTTYIPTNEASNKQVLTGPVENQCYYAPNFTENAFLPATFLP